MDTSWCGPAMFAVALACLLVGYPVAFTLGGVAVLFSLLGVATGTFDPAFLTALSQRMFGIMANFTLLAIPAFVFMGAMLERSGIAERLLHTMAALLGRIRGGLALAVVVVGALLAATTGVVAATVVTMGLISLPTMLRNGYDKSFATGVIAASGTLGQIIPPSIVLVVLADQLGVSVGDLFIGSIVPGLLMATAFAVYVLVAAHLKPAWAPLPADPRAAPGGSAPLGTVPAVGLGEGVVAMLPPLALILCVLGSIFFGVATPTEAGVIGAIGAMAMAAGNGQLNRRTLQDVSESTLATTAMVLFILLGSTAFSLVFRGFDGDRLIAQLLLNLPGEATGFLLLSMATIFLLGFFIDFFEIAFIVVPLFAPVARELFGPEALVWYGVIVGANLQSSFLTPPFGFALFYLRGVAPAEVSTQQIYRGALPFIALQLAVLALIIAVPPLVTGLSELAR